MRRTGPPRERAERVAALRRALLERVLVLDGAMGTAIQEHHLAASDFGGGVYEGCNEQLVRTRPDLIRGIYTSYLQAGADILKTNTFGATPLVYHCVQAGLDLAIVNAEKLERYPSIPEKDRRLPEDVLFVRGEGATADERMRSATTAFTAHFRERNPRAPVAEKLGLDERLARYASRRWCCTTPLRRISPSPRSSPPAQAEGGYPRRIRRRTRAPASSASASQAMLEPTLVQPLG
jgi:hypothetical protein